MVELHRRNLAARGLSLSSSLDSYLRILPRAECEACRHAYAVPCERRDDLPDRVSICADRANDRSVRLCARPACPGIRPSTHTHQLLRDEISISSTSAPSPRKADDYKD